MGVHGRLTFFLLLSLRAPALPDLPRVVALSEDAVPGTCVAKVTVSCSNASGSPNVTLRGIEPGHPFNPVAISADPVAAATFQAEVTLRAGAELDAHRVNQYTLTLRATCPSEEEVEERLFVRVTMGQALRCDAPFASAEGDVVWVLADVAPRTPLYAVLLQPLGGLTFRLRNHNTPLTLTRHGLVLAPASGFDRNKDTQVPETVSPGSTLVTLRCTDPASAGGNLHYALEGPLASRSHFRMEGPQLQVNATLDYDSEAAAAMGFQFTATIVVSAGGQPPRSTHVPLLVTVTPVNEFTPVCPNDATFTVPETAAFGSAVGRVAGTDGDYPLNSLEYSLEGDPGPTQPFSIDTHTGEIRVVGPLDFQRQKSYRLTVQLTDTRNDLDPAKRRSRLCDVAVRLQQPVLDQAPVCTPEVQELRITAGLGSRQPVTRLACQGSPDGVTLSYAIAGGNEDGRFRLEGNTLFYLSDDLPEPCTFVLLVEVWGSPGVPRHSTVVALVVHVTPRSTPVPPSTTTRRTTLQKEPLIVTLTEVSWHPPAWFVAVLTVSGALLLAALGCVARSLLCSNRDPGKPLLGKRWVLDGQGGHIGSEGSRDVVEQKGGEEEQGHPHTGSLGQFDGRARDPRPAPEQPAGRNSANHAGNMKPTWLTCFWCPAPS
ncbi:cadherin-related family member 4 [Grus japonensis]|uniref:Cadherin-related family member 4 n=1 Tax=Grus japonensis TaxID=30415 RepID=A0ABC9XAL1_GRUJA